MARHPLIVDPGAPACAGASDRATMELPAAGPPPARATAGPRLHYVDGLRLLALAGVFMVHVSMVFNPFDVWHIQNAERSRVLGEVAVLMAPWVMPLFMLLAGVSAWYSLRWRASLPYLRERTRRVLLPLLVGIPLLVTPQVYLERRLRGQFTGSFIDFLPHFFQGIYPEGNLSWHHLWFLAHLFVYSIVALPLFRFWQGERGRDQLRRIARWTAGHGGLLWLALPLILERSVLWSLFLERHMLTSDWSNQALLFVAYLYGFALAAEPAFGEQTDRQWPRAAVHAVLTTLVVGWLAWIGYLPRRLPAPYAPGYTLFWTLYAMGAWAWLIALLGAGRRWIRSGGAVLQLARRRGMLWYLLHQTVIVGVAYLLVPTTLDVRTKFVMLLVTSAALTLLGGELLARAAGAWRGWRSRNAPLPGV